MFYQKKLMIKKNGVIVRNNNFSIKEQKKGFTLKGKINGKKVRHYYKKTMKRYKR